MGLGRFITNEYYHVYNRGVEKRNIFSDSYDRDRFIRSMIEFNTLEPIGSLYENTFNIRLGRKKPAQKLVDIICYCLNPNHYHFLLHQHKEGGISEFMKRLSGGYTKYFNKKYRRSGVLFQGVFKSTHVNSNEYLLHLSAYINLNYRVHRLGRETSKSSFDEFVNPLKFSKSLPALCNPSIVMNQFEDPREYRNFAEDALETILQKKILSRELETLLLE